MSPRQPLRQYGHTVGWVKSKVLGRGDQRGDRQPCATTEQPSHRVPLHSHWINVHGVLYLLQSGIGEKGLRAARCSLLDC